MVVGIVMSDACHVVRTLRAGELAACGTLRWGGLAGVHGTACSVPAMPLPSGVMYRAPGLSCQRACGDLLQACEHGLG